MSEQPPAPLVTVILPVFNAADGIRDALERLSSLTHRELDVLVVDDGSSDDTADIVQDHCRGDERFRLERLPANGGVAAARNAALAQVRGEFVWFVDWDDAWDPCIVSVLVDLAVRQAADIAICGALHVRAVGQPGRVLDRISGNEVLSGIECQNRMLRGEVHGYLWSKLFRATLLEDFRFPLLSSLSDYAGVIELVPRADRVAATDELLYWHLMRPGSITNTKTVRLDNIVYCHDRMLEVARPRTPPPDETLLRYYSCWALHLALVQTVLRLRLPTSVYRRYQVSAAGAMTWRDVANCLRFDRTMAGKAALVKLLGAYYVHAYRLVVSSRSLGRRVTGRA